jgi:hypothetical protein
MSEADQQPRTVHGDVARRPLPSGGKTGTPQTFCPAGMPWDTFHGIVTSRQRAETYTRATETFAKLAAQAKADFEKHSPEDVARIQLPEK